MARRNKKTVSVATLKSNTRFSNYYLLLTFGLLFLIGLLIYAGPSNRASAGDITVYKSPTCGCCEKWINHLRDAGFDVNSVNRNDMGAIKSSFGVKRNLQSCHTASIDGYTVEGHVPAGDIKRMLREKPVIAGLAAPGMPIGSPGMESGGGGSFDVVTFDKTGRTTVYAAH